VVTEAAEVEAPEAETEAVEADEIVEAVEVEGDADESDEAVADAE
jgi:hypothetical protein